MVGHQLWAPLSLKNPFGPCIWTLSIQQGQMVWPCPPFSHLSTENFHTCLPNKHTQTHRHQVAPTKWWLQLGIWEIPIINLDGNITDRILRTEMHNWSFLMAHNDIEKLRDIKHYLDKVMVCSFAFRCWYLKVVFLISMISLFLF